jgi:subtilisin family serine protease
MASKKRSASASAGSNKRISGMGGADVPESIFAGGSDIVPGEVIVQLDGSASASITQSIPRGRARTAAADSVTTFGVGALDQALAKLKVSSVTRLHPPAPVASRAMTEAVAMGDTFRVTFDKRTPAEQAAQQLSQVAGVQYAEPNRYRETSITPNDPSFASQWGLNKINVPAAWDRTTGSASVVVAVIDTGVDLNHPELAPLLVPGFDMVDLGASPTPPAGFRFEGDFQTRDSVPQDEVGHGTHVAGTIACLSNNSQMVAGVTWQCRLMPIKVLTRIVKIANPADVRGTGSAADISAGIRWAVDNGARVINLSLGGSADTMVERDAVAYAIANGVVVVAAMGNAGAAGPISYPAAYPGVVAVGAIDIADRRASFSQVGPHIDVVAPGVDVLSTVWNDSTATMSGTSMASPHVAGVAALVLSIKPSLSGAQVADILRQTARPLRDNPGDPVPNNNYGFGCVDALGAVNRASPPVLVTALISCVPTSAVNCVFTRSISCNPTLAISCRPSTLIVCRPTFPVTCLRPTTLVACLRPTTPVNCLQPTHSIQCSAPSAIIACPSAICPTTLACGNPGLPFNPGLGDSGQGYGVEGDDADPYGGEFPQDGQ